MEAYHTRITELFRSYALDPTAQLMVLCRAALACYESPKRGLGFLKDYLDHLAANASEHDLGTRP
jgi:hypothetical protein